MTPYRYVRPLEPDERAALEAGLGSADAFVRRRCQIVLGSAARAPVPVLAKRVGRTERNVHAVLEAFEARGLACLRRRRSRPHPIHAAFPPERAASLKALLHQSPRVFGKPTSLWTLDLAADVSFEQGLTPERVTGETIRATLARLGVRWQRAKDWIEIGDDLPPLDRPSCVHALDAGGLIWAGEASYPTIDDALRDLDAAIGNWLREELGE